MKDAIRVFQDDDQHLTLRWRDHEVVALITDDGRLWVTVMAPGADTLNVWEHVSKDNVMRTGNVVCTPPNSTVSA